MNYINIFFIYTFFSSNIEYSNRNENCPKVKKSRQRLDKTKSNELV